MGGLAARQCGSESGARQALGGDIQQLEPAGGELLLYRGSLPRRQTRVQGPGRKAASPQHVDLILHQGDERGDDDRGSFEQQRRELETERFPRSGGHDGYEVSPLENREGGVALSGPECGKPEPLVKRALQQERHVDGVIGDLGHRRNLAGSWRRDGIEKARWADNP